MTSPLDELYREIPLTQGQVALVSECDYERVSALKWQAHKNPSSGRFYAVHNFCKGGKYGSFHMGRFILGLQLGDKRKADHINRENTLDNRRSNLRIATHAQNCQNTQRYKNNTSGHKGVYPRCGKWTARIQANNFGIFLGWFDTKEEAIVAYTNAAKSLHKEFANPE